MKLFAAMLAAGVLGSGMAVGSVFACDKDGCAPETTVVVATEDGECGGCHRATEVVVAEKEGCDSATEAVVAADGGCEGCDSAEGEAEVVVAEGGCGDCDTVCGTCEVYAALKEVELSEHGQAVLALGQAGVPVWLDEAGFGLVDGEKVDCPVAFSRAATAFIAKMGAEAGCEVCQEVVATSEPAAATEGTEETVAKEAPAE